MMDEADSASDALTAESLLSNWLQKSTDLLEMATEEFGERDDDAVDDMEDDDWVKK